MLNKNSVLTGSVIGALLPALSLFIFLYILKGQYVYMNKPGIPYFTAICLNLFITRYYFKKGLDKTGTGIAVISFIFMLAIFVFKLQPIR